LRKSRYGRQFACAAAVGMLLAERLDQLRHGFVCQGYFGGFLSFSMNTRIFAGAVSLAFADTTCSSVGSS